MKIIKSYNLEQQNADFIDQEALLSGVSNSKYLDQLIEKARASAVKLPKLSRSFLKGEAE